MCNALATSGSAEAKSHSGNCLHLTSSTTRGGHPGSSGALLAAETPSSNRPPAQQQAAEGSGACTDAHHIV
jgi:hypothetical protein